MIFIRKREPHKEFTPSKAYTYNFAAMRTIDDSVWGEAMNDPSWIRFITARHPHMKYIRNRARSKGVEEILVASPLLRF